MKILIIESDATLALRLENNLRLHGYEVCSVKSIEDATGVIFADSKSYKMIIMDLDEGLNYKQALDFIVKVRLKKINLSILVFSVEKDVVKRIEIMEMGATDYILKPFSLSELVSKIGSILKLSKVSLSSTDKFRFDFAKRLALINNKKIHLTKKESDILRYLVDNPNRVVTRDMIFENTWSFNSSLSSNTIDVHVKNLRKKLSSYISGGFIETIWGSGYMFLR